MIGLSFDGNDYQSMHFRDCCFASLQQGLKGPRGHCYGRRPLKPSTSTFFLLTCLVCHLLRSRVPLNSLNAANDLISNISASDCCKTTQQSEPVSSVKLPLSKSCVASITKLPGQRGHHGFTRCLHKTTARDFSLHTGRKYPGPRPCPAYIAPIASDSYDETIGPYYFTTFSARLVPFGPLLRGQFLSLPCSLR